MKKTVLQRFENFDHDKQEYIRHAWNAFTVHLDKERGLWFAYKAKQFLDAQQLTRVDGKLQSEQVYKQGLGYHVVVMLYVWNNWFAEAFQMDHRFLYSMHVEHFSEGIKQYLEMLMVKRQRQRLDDLFGHPEFKEAFLDHYDVYHSLLVNPSHPINDMKAFVPLVNKVNKLAVGYGEPAFVKA